MLTTQKYCKCLSPLVQIGCFGGADLVQQWLQPLRGEQQVVEAKHKLHWKSCSVLQKLHVGFEKFQSTHHFVYAIRQAQVTRSCGKLLLKFVLLFFLVHVNSKVGEMYIICEFWYFGIKMSKLKKKSSYNAVFCTFGSLSHIFIIHKSFHLVITIQISRDNSKGKSFNCVKSQFVVW